MLGVEVFFYVILIGVLVFYEGLLLWVEDLFVIDVSLVCVYDKVVEVDMIV